MSIYFLSRFDIYSLRCQEVMHEMLCTFLGITHTHSKRTLLRHYYATRQNVTGLIPNEIIGFFN
jgi:hypothetical protein